MANMVKLLRQFSCGLLWFKLRQGVGMLNACNLCLDGLYNRQVFTDMLFYK